MRRGLGALAAAGLLAGLWLLYVSSFGIHELLAGVPSVILAAVASEAVREQNQPRFLLHGRMLLAFRSVPAEVLSDSVRIAAKLLQGFWTHRRPRGKFVLMRFQPGGHDGSAAARRTLATEFATMSPNSIVLGVSRRRRGLLLHQLLTGDAPAAARILGSEDAQ